MVEIETLDVFLTSAGKLAVKNAAVHCWLIPETREAVSEEEAGLALLFVGAEASEARAVSGDRPRDLKTAATMPLLQSVQRAVREVTRGFVRTQWGQGELGRATHLSCWRRKPELQSPWHCCR